MLNVPRLVRGRIAERCETMNRRKGMRLRAAALLAGLGAALCLGPWEHAQALPDRESTGQEGALESLTEGIAVRQEGVQRFQICSGTDSDRQAELAYTYTGVLAAPVEMRADGTAAACTVSCAEETQDAAVLDAVRGKEAWVYLFTECESQGDSVLAVEFRVDPETTSVLTCGFDVLETEMGTGKVRCALQTENAAEKAYIILLGYDMDAFDVFGYPDMRFDCAGDRESVSAVYTRYVSTAEDMLETAASLCLDASARGAAQALAADAAAVLAENGQPVNRLEDVFKEPMEAPRQLTLHFTVSLPARQSITVEVCTPEHAKNFASGR